jgi:hypothetical protein
MSLQKKIIVLLAKCGYNEWDYYESVGEILLNKYEKMFGILSPSYASFILSKMDLNINDGEFISILLQRGAQIHKDNMIHDFPQDHLCTITQWYIYKSLTKFNVNKTFWIEPFPDILNKLYDMCDNDDIIDKWFHEIYEYQQLIKVTDSSYFRKSSCYL